MKGQRSLQKISAGTSLIVLSLGFSRFLLPGTSTVLQQATSKFGRCSMRQQRVLDRWQFR
jgi:hypothetical protein